MTDWKWRMESAFIAYSSYRPGNYVRQFPSLQRLSLKQPDSLTTDDVVTLLWQGRHVGDRNLVAHYLTKIMEHYVEGRMYAYATRLYAALLAWLDAWSRDEYEALSEALVLQWHNTVEHPSPPYMTVTTGSVAFLLLWLEDPAPLEPVLLDLAQRYYRQEVEYEWDDAWGSETWTPFIGRVRSAPIESLLTYATGGELGLPEFGGRPSLDERVLAVLHRTGIM